METEKVERWKRFIKRMSNQELEILTDVAIEKAIDRIHEQKENPPEPPTPDVKEQ